MSDINSEDDVEELKKSRKNRAKKVMSSSDDSDIDTEGIPLPPCPKIPQMKPSKCTTNSSQQVDNLKQQCKSKKKTFIFYRMFSNLFFK